MARRYNTVAEFFLECHSKGIPVITGSNKVMRPGKIFKDRDTGQKIVVVRTVTLEELNEYRAKYFGEGPCEGRAVCGIEITTD